MALILIEDFTDNQISNQLTDGAGYLLDSRVVSYWHGLASDFSIPIANLPLEADITQVVKDYLIVCVSMHVASDNIGGDLTELQGGVTYDLWEGKYTSLEARKSVLMGMMSAEDVYDPTNPPETNTSNQNIMTWTTA